MSNTSRQRRRDKHIHKFIKVPNKSKTKFTWRCAQIDCAYALYPSQEEYLLKRESICWECERIFTMTEKSIAQALPLCSSCSEETVKITILPDGRELSDAELWDEIEKENKAESSVVERIKAINKAG